MPTPREDWNALIDAELAPLGLSSSAVAVWKLFRDIAVTTAMSSEAIAELLKADIDNALATKEYGSLPWYARIAKEFQYGHTLIVTDGVVGYATDDAAARIITQAAVREIDDEVIVIKVAKTVGSSLAALSADELTAFRNYLKARRAPGAAYAVVSTPADTLKYVLDLSFDPRFDFNSLRTQVAAALDAFKLNFPFDAVLYRSQFDRAIMNVPGILDTGPSFLRLTTNTGTVIPDITTSEVLPAGYFNYDPLSIINLTPA